MILPYMTNQFYRFLAKTTPPAIKPVLKMYYNKLNNLMVYGTTNIFTAVDIEINSKCNLKCSYCPVSQFDLGDYYMPWETFKKIIDDLKTVSYEGRISPSFYGEPFLDDRLIDWLAYARKQLPKAQLIIHSNGTFLNQKLFDDLKSKSKINGIFVTKHLPNYPAPLLKILKDDPEAKKIIKLREIESLNLFNRSGTVEHPNIKKMNRCYFITDQIAIDRRGNTICSNDFFSKEIYGNVNDNHLIYDIWRNRKFQETRKRLRKGHFDSLVCQKCANQTGL